MRRYDALSPRTLSWVAVVTAILGYLVQRLFTSHFGRMPLPSWPGLVLVAALSVGLLSAALPIRRWRAGHRERRLDPIAAFRILVLARAAALAGSVVAGWYAAYALILAPDAGQGSVSSSVIMSAAYVTAGLLLVGVGLLVQTWFRVDPPDDRDSADSRDGWDD